MKKRSDPRRNIALFIVIVLAVLVGIAVVIERLEKGRKEATPSSMPHPGGQRERIVEYALPELLVKGCLFNLGIDRRDVRFKGDTVNVAVRTLPTADQISRAFKPIEDVGNFDIESSRHIRVNINSSRWDIFFSSPAEKLAARCAIIVDDMGMSMELARDLAGIDANLTFAVLPRSPESESVARFLHTKGHEVLLHLPMKGNGKDPGPGAILDGMPPSQILAILKDDLGDVPFISGVNNHMGSLVTADQDIMRLVMKEMKEKGLFFVDSLTTSKSVCREAAEEYKVPFIARDVFLDNDLDREYIASQVEKLLSISMKYSSAIAICHPHPETVAVLKREIPRIRESGVEIVKVSALIDQSGEGR